MGSRIGFTELLLGGVIALILTGSGIALTLYLLPGEHLEIPELQPAMRVTTEDDFPPGASRVVAWGDQIILVIRRDEQRYYALQGTSPTDGCVLQWDKESLRVVSPCTHVNYDVIGNVVVGLTMTPLRRYSVLVRGGVVYVGG